MVNELESHTQQRHDIYSYVFSITQNLFTTSIYHY